MASQNASPMRSQRELGAAVYGHEQASAAGRRQDGRRQGMNAACAIGVGRSAPLGLFPASAKETDR